MPSAGSRTPRAGRRGSSFARADGGAWPPGVYAITRGDSAGDADRHVDARAPGTCELRRRRRWPGSTASRPRLCCGHAAPALPQGPAGGAALPSRRRGDPGDHVGDRPLPGDQAPDQGLLGVPRHDHGLAAAEPLVRRLPPAVPLDRAHPELAARGRALRLRGRRRRLPQEQRHDDGAALQPDEAKPRRRAGPRPHHRGRRPRAWTRPSLEYPVKPGLIFCLDRAFPFELNEIIVEKAIGWRDRGVVGIDIAGPESATFRVADYRRLFRRARQFGLGPDGPHRRVRPGRGGRPGRRAARAGPASATASRPPTTRGRWR